MDITSNSLKSVFYTTHIVQFGWGLILGIFQYVYYVFLYGHLGGTPDALTYIASIIVLARILVFILEIPAGAFGDYIGRKKTLILAFSFGTIDFFLRTWIYFIPSLHLSLLFAVLASIFGAVCITLFSGSFTAWVVDSIRETGLKEGHGRLLARSNGTMIVGKLIGAVIGLSFFLWGEVAYAFGIGCVAFLLCTLYLAIAMKETASMKFHEGPFLLADSIHQMKDIINNAYKVCIQQPPVTYLIIIKVCFMTLIHIVLFLWPIAMKANFGIEKMSLYWFAIVLTSFVSSFAGTKILDMIHKVTLKRSHERLSNEKLWLWLMGVCSLSAVAILVLGFSKIYGGWSISLFILCLAIFNIGYGFLIPAHETIINYYIPVKNSAQRATILSVSSMLTSLVMAIIMFPSTGPTGEKTTIGWILPASILLFVGIITHIFMRRYQRKIGELTIKPGLVEGSL